MKTKTVEYVFNKNDARLELMVVNDELTKFSIINKMGGQKYNIIVFDRKQDMGITRQMGATKFADLLTTLRDLRDLLDEGIKEVENDSKNTDGLSD